MSPAVDQDGIACCVAHFIVQIINEQKVQECDASKA